MKIACLQFAPKLGARPANAARADALLTISRLAPGDVDILLLPELAFSGYNFPSAETIEPFLEPTASGFSATWARQTAARLGCVVSVGYPEVAEEDDREKTGADAKRKRYNSVVAVAPDGKVLMHYRKSFLYYTDESWAEEGDGFYTGTFEADVLLKSGRSRPVMRPASTSTAEEHNGDGSTTDTQNGTSTTDEESSVVRVAAGICMDINPYKFTAPEELYEFGTHCVSANADLVLFTMAFMTHQSIEDITGPGASQPDLSLLAHFFSRLKTLAEQDRDTVMVLANRSGNEGDAIYAGTSSVVRLGRGRMDILSVMGTGDEGLLVVDTEDAPKATLRAEKAG